MLYELIALVVICVLFLAAVLYLSSKNGKTELEKKELEKKCEETQERIVKLEKENSSLKKELEMLQKNEEYTKEVFENVANALLEKTAKKTQSEIVKILDPFEDSINEFKQRINSMYMQESKTFGELFNELKNLKELNASLSQEAKNLSNALHSQSKTQGMWGEMILEKVLEMSGLRKGIEYEREVTFNIDGKKYRADVVVNLPDGKKLLIDAKTSLKDYVGYINTKDEKFLKKHIESVKNHIKELACKEYEKFKRGFEFVFMFFPVDNSLNVVLQNDSSIYEDAFREKIILVSPSTLLPALRAVESIWRFERQNENIKEVIKKIEKLYDKVRIFIDEYEKVGKSINNAKEMYDKSHKRLNEMIVFQIEDIKKTSGIKPKKEIKS